MYSLGWKRGAAVLAHREGQVRPEERVDRIEVLHGVDGARIVGVEVQRGAGIEAEVLVEALRLRPQRRRLAEMPLAEAERAVAARAQQLGERDLPGGTPSASIGGTSRSRSS